MGSIVSGVKKWYITRRNKSISAEFRAVVDESNRIYPASIDGMEERNRVLSIQAREARTRLMARVNPESARRILETSRTEILRNRESILAARKSIHANNDSIIGFQSQLSRTAQLEMEETKAKYMAKTAVSPEKRATRSVDLHDNLDQAANSSAAVENELSKIDEHHSTVRQLEVTRQNRENRARDEEVVVAASTSSAADARMSDAELCQLDIFEDDDQAEVQRQNDEINLLSLGGEYAVPSTRLVDAEIGGGGSVHSSTRKGGYTAVGSEQARALIPKDMQ
jgi:hypothetical protein